LCNKTLVVVVVTIETVMFGGTDLGLTLIFYARRAYAVVMFAIRHLCTGRAAHMGKHCPQVSALVMVAALIAMPVTSRAAVYRSPVAVDYAPDGATLAVADYTAGEVLVLRPGGEVHKRVALRGRPSGLAWTRDGSRLFVTERGAGTVAELDPAAGKVVRRLRTGRYPVGVAVSDTRLVVANSGLDTVSIINLADGKETASIACVHRPRQVALTPDGGKAVVGNLLPAGDAREATMACAVTLIDVAGGTKIADIKLPPGSISVRGVAVSPDGRWAYAVHSLGRFTLPTTQLERGWVMTHAMSVIDIEAGKHYATVLLDLLMEGGADPWGIALTADGNTAWITLAGVYQVARLDLAKLHGLLEREPARRAGLVNDLAALYKDGIITRTGISARGPRGLALSHDGKTMAVASYFGGELVLLRAADLAETGRVALGPQPESTQERLGEQHFFDANLCFQKWLSCGSCHPDGRADALNWDLLNDGMGNPKNTKSLVLSHRTPPVMSTGARPSMETATEKGFTFIQFRVVDEEVMQAVRAYQRSLQPEPSPYLQMSEGKKLACNVCHHGGAPAGLPERHMAIDGELTPAARRGAEIFKDKEVGCARCHPGPLFTDLKTHDVGTRHELDRRDAFDNPTCLELWRTAPFLHDGSAATLMDVLAAQNEGDKHGKTSHLSAEERKALVEYLRSL